MKELSEEHQMLEMFDRLDHDKSGFIEREELVKQLGDIFHAKEVCVCVCVCVCALLTAAIPILSYCRPWLR